MSHSTHSSESSRPLNLASLLSAEHQKAKKQREQQILAELDSPRHDSSTNANVDFLPQKPLEQSQAGPEPDQAQKQLDLSSLVDRVRLAQKQDPSSLQTPVEETPPPIPAAPPVAQPESRHWYSSLLPRRRRDASENSTATSSSEPSAVPTPVAQRPKPPPKELTTVDHVANAFASTSRVNNLETIEFTVDSLAVTGAAAPAFLLQRDDRGRRPPPILFQLLRLGIVDSKVNPGVSRQIIFRIELQYGDCKWVIYRTLYEFYKLHLVLSAKQYENMPRFPNQVSWALSMAKAGFGIARDDQDAYSRETNRLRRKALQKYLLEVLQGLNGVVAYDLYEFLEISALSLTRDMGWKGKEGFVMTKAVDTSKTLCGIPIGFDDWDRRWAILRDSYLAFAADISSEDCRDVFIFDQNFYVRDKENHYGLHTHHIEIGNGHHRIEIKGERSREMAEWVDHIRKMQQASPWVKGHRFGSFAPEREDANVRYYVDGKDYFHAVSDAILAAKHEIYIADWWLSPELYLRRPPEKNEEFRLDRLLKRKAEEGVKIYVVVYKEISLALTLDSAHTKTWLQDLHPNIQVQRHPDHISVTATQFWAHHEKICVIDCRLAFIGGLDLCFGRYDSRTHQLSDYHPSRSGTIWPGQDYSNPRIKDFTNVKDYNNDLIERKLLSRMPWHDVSVGVAGQPARDIARHFVQRWNFVKLEKGMKKPHMKFLTPKGEFVSTRNESGWTGSQKVQILRSSTTWSQGVDTERSIQDAYLASIDNAKHFIYIENQFFVTLAAENGNPELVNTIGIALVNRIVRAHSEGKKFRVIVVMPLMPAFEADIMSSEAGTLRKVMHFQYVSICRGGNSVLEELVAQGIDPDQYIGFYGLRSFDRIKHGKFDAIVEAVKEAEAAGALNVSSVGPEGQAAPEQALQRSASPNGKGTSQTAEGGDIHRNKSLAAKFLLDPIPCDKEAQRIKRISDKRRPADLMKTWDESITKRAMNLGKKEHGYVPATTERSLANRKLNRRIRDSTHEAERKAKKNHYQGGTTENSEPHIAEGLGGKIRTAVNTATQPKDQGGLEPMSHKVANHPIFHRGESNKVGSVNGDPSPQLASEKKDDKEHAVVKDKRDAEQIIEPSPHASQSQTGESSSAPRGAAEQEDDDDDSNGENKVVDNEVDDFVTEQLYIHSKLMIVDDRIIIIGSANINDRSQSGFRDSEIAMIIEDQETVPSKMNGVEYQAGKMAHKLRTDLFKEHLGLLPHVEHDVVTKGSVLPVDLDAPSQDPAQVRKDLIRAAHEQQEQQRKNIYGSQGHLQVTMPPEGEEAEAFTKWHACAQSQAKKAAAKNPETANDIVMDPLHDDFYESWWKRVANTNTLIFREVFHCVPDNTVETWDQYKAFVPDSKKVLTGHVAMPGGTVENVTEKLQQVTGHLVEFPTKFLCQENLLGSAVEGVVTPMEIFT
ncbi:hypothetical protein BGZ70_003198 [Mortierella alpina]|uniref:Phospholipase n=1 Tax=Mortierella alpina TaxID=64518 RepID=A0A9P6JAH8_MORAP|nr:hypothetical protein BGZ70_003198 [Mortierella alpina]